jgi:ABC-type sugar transport system ATPase subunit
MSLLEMKGIRKSYYGVEVLHGWILRSGRAPCMR